jgi:hypothetical protein
MSMCSSELVFPLLDEVNGYWIFSYVLFQSIDQLPGDEPFYEVLLSVEMSSLCCFLCKLVLTKIFVFFFGGKNSTPITFLQLFETSQHMIRVAKYFFGGSCCSNLCQQDVKRL